MVKCREKTTTPITPFTEIRAPAHLGPGEIDGLLVPPGKACSLLTDYLNTGELLGSEFAQEKRFQVKPSAPISLFGLVGRL